MSKKNNVEKTEKKQDEKQRKKEEKQRKKDERQRLKQTKARDVTKTAIILYACVIAGIGLIVLLVCIILIQCFPRDEHVILGIVVDFYINIANIMITLGIGTIILDFFALLDYVSERLNDILIKDEYISSLELEKQKVLMNKLQKYIYYNVNLDDDGLLKFVQDEIHSLIKDYYYKEYITHVVCKLEDNKIKKNIKRRIVITNKCCETKPVDLSTLFKTEMKGTEEDAKKSIELISFSINNEKKVIIKDYASELKKNEYGLKYEKIESNNVYCHSFSLNGANIFVGADDIIIDIEINTAVEIVDYIYTQRVKKPCRNYTIHFYFDSKDFDVNCDAFGFMSKNIKDRVIETDLENCVVVRFTNWILPGDGVAFNILKKTFLKDK